MYRVERVHIKKMSDDRWGIWYVRQRVFGFAGRFPVGHEVCESWEAAMKRAYEVIGLHYE